MYYSTFGYWLTLHYVNSTSIQKLRGRSGFRYSFLFIRRGCGLWRGAVLYFSLCVLVPKWDCQGSVSPSFLFCPQFLCLKNIRTFLSTCCEKFGLKRSELFEAFDLFDVQDFGKVSWAHRVQSLVFNLFPWISTPGRLRAVRGRTDVPCQTITKCKEPVLGREELGSSPCFTTCCVTLDMWPCLSES